MGQLYIPTGNPWVSHGRPMGETWVGHGSATYTNGKPMDDLYVTHVWPVTHEF